MGNNKKRENSTKSTRAIRKSTKEHENLEQCTKKTAPMYRKTIRRLRKDHKQHTKNCTPTPKHKKHSKVYNKALGNNQKATENIETLQEPYESLQRNETTFTNV